MQSDDATEPAHVRELARTLREWAAISQQMVDLLYETAGHDRSRNWRPHFGQIVNAVQAFGDRCRMEAQTAGCWRVDGLDDEAAFDLVREQGQRLVDWLQRMMTD